MARAALAAGADAVMIDVHAHPEQAMVDGAQALLPEEIIELGRQLAAIADALGRPMNR
jgi:3-deoxy-7-phosphoheptulonate synthase